MDGQVTEGVKDRQREERHKSEVLRHCAQELSQRYAEALTEVLKGGEVALSDAAYLKILRAMDRANAQYRATISGPYAFAQKSAGLRFVRGYFTPKPPFTREQRERLYRQIVGDESLDAPKEAATPAPIPVPVQVPEPPKEKAPPKKRPSPPQQPNQPGANL